MGMPDDGVETEVLLEANRQRIGFVATTAIID